MQQQTIKFMAKKLRKVAKKKVTQKVHTISKSSKSKTAKSLFSKMMDKHREIDHKKSTIAALRFEVERHEIEFEVLRKKHAKILTRIEAEEKSKR